MSAFLPGVLSPNDLFLLAAVGPVTPDPQLAAWVRAPGFSWERALEDAARNRVAAAAATLALCEPLAAEMDETLKKRWLELRDAAQRRTENAARELRIAAEAMVRRGAEPLLYKGLDFAALCYPNGVPRSFNDIDVIVRPHDAEAAAAALHGEGYDLPPGTPSLDYFRRFHLHAIFLDGERKRLPLELHWALESPHAGVPDVIPRYFERAAAAPELGGVLRPDPVDSLAFMAGHLEKHLGLSALLPTREARLESVIEAHGLLWVYDVVLWMRALGADADGERVGARMRELAAADALAVSLRLAMDLDPDALPAWAVAEAERLPGATPFIARLIYPDLHAGGPPQERWRRRRAWAYRTLPEVGFAPISALQALLPSPRVPGSESTGGLSGLLGLPAKLYLVAANAVAVVRWRLDRWREERRQLEPGASPGQPGD